MRVKFMPDAKAAWIVRMMAAFCLENVAAFHAKIATDSRNDDVPVPSVQDLEDMLHAKETKE